MRKQKMVKIIASHCRLRHYSRSPTSHHILAMARRKVLRYMHRVQSFRKLQIRTIHQFWLNCVRWKCCQLHAGNTLDPFSSYSLLRDVVFLLGDAYLTDDWMMYFWITVCCCLSSTHTKEEGLKCLWNAWNDDLTFWCNKDLHFSNNSCQLSQVVAVENNERMKSRTGRNARQAKRVLLCQTKGRAGCLPECLS